MEQVDVAVVGAGGAGLTLLHQLALRGPRRLRVALVDPVNRLAARPADRTWCFWDDGRSDVDQALCRSWDRVVVVGRDHRRRVLQLAPMRYVMLRSEDFYALVAERSARLDVVHVPHPAGRVVDGEPMARVHTVAGPVQARWVFDSRPAVPARQGATALLQHFRGVVVRAAGRPAFDPDLPLLMDFTTPQPPSGLSFGYCLPIDAFQALVEYTEFSPAQRQGASALALEAYLAHALGGTVPHEVLRAEQGAIPMTDAALARRAGRRVFRLGTAGGATRPATGYTFAAMNRQAVAVAAALAAGTEPLPPRPYPRRHAWMDAVLLRALADDRFDGPAFFTRLFDRNPPQRVLRFLDGASGPASEIAVMATAPRGPMLRAAASLVARRAPAAALRRAP